MRGEDAEDLAWLEAEAGSLPAQCVDRKRLDSIQDYFSARPLAQVHMTTRVVAG